MRRLLLPVLPACAAFVVAAASAAAVGAGRIQLTPVGRMPFPERGYVLDLPDGVAIGPRSVVVEENGHRVSQLDVRPLGAAGIRVGVVLAVDASDSMAGHPIRAAVAAARTFVARRQPDELVGLVSFNDKVGVLQPLTRNDERLRQRLTSSPSLAYGTHIYDGLDRSLSLLQRGEVSTGSIVLLSDGADVGSRSSLARIVAVARARHVRIFTVGLRSGAFDPVPLRALAAETGGTFAEATRTSELAPIYRALRSRLAGEYLLEYRSDALPKTHVNVAVRVAGIGAVSTGYRAPTPSGLTPFHRSLWTRFVTNPAAGLVLALLVAALAALAVVALVRPRGTDLVERLESFGGAGKRAKADVAPIARSLAARARPRGGWFGRLERDLEIARIDMSATRVVMLTLAATVLVIVLLALISPIFVVIGVLTPLVTRALVRRKLKQVRDAFADQLPPNLQVLASALRIGHSFSGALAVVVENAHEPSQSELRRAVTDEQLGVPVEEAIRRIAERMASRDLEQVALLAELQRTAGGNAAEVLDTVVGTLRERADVRRLLKTLTAQGRMARWILTGLPVVTGAVLFLSQGAMMRPLFTTSVGQTLLVLAVFLVTAGSMIIQRIVQVEA